MTDPWDEKVYFPNMNASIFKYGKLVCKIYPSRPMGRVCGILTNQINALL